MSIHIKKRYDQTTKTALSFKDQLSKTKQSFRDEVDINQIIQKYNKTGQLPSLIQQNPKYGDFSNPQDYQESLNTILLANEQFSALSSKIRSRFNNDPIKLLEFVSDKQNKEEMYSLGLAIRPDPTPNLEANTGKAGNNLASGKDAQPAAQKGN